jgi:hypothetical protein
MAQDHRGAAGGEREAPAEPVVVAPPGQLPDGGDAIFTRHYIFSMDTKELCRVVHKFAAYG